MVEAERRRFCPCHKGIKVSLAMCKEMQDDKDLDYDGDSAGIP